MGLFSRRPEVPEIEFQVSGDARTASNEERVAAQTAARDAYRDSKEQLDAFLERRFGPAPFLADQLAPPTVCPSCGSAFDAPVLRSKKCPECKAKMIVRTFGDNKKLLSEDQAAALDEHKHLIASFRKAYRRVENLGVGVPEFTKTFESLGPGFTSRDASWRILNEQAIEAMRLGDFHHLKMAYLTQAIQLRDEERDAVSVLGLAREAELLEIKSNGVCETVEILACNCPKCSPDDHRELQWSEFHDGEFGPRGPLPHSDCEKGFCTCSYVGQVEW